MNKLEEMTAFVKVVELGSISRAADHLKLGKSAVSRRLADLEERLGARLLSRTTRRMSLTDSGKTFYARCTEILADVDDAELCVSQSRQDLTGPLKIAAPLSFGLLHLQSIVTEFQQTHPQVILDLELNDRRIDVIEEGFDLAIRIGELADSSLIARRIAPIRTVICAAPEFWQKHGTPSYPEELQQLPCIHYSNTPTNDRITLYDQKQQATTIRVQAQMLCNNTEFTRPALLAGIGFSLVPTFIVYRDLERKALVPVLQNYHYKNMSLNALYPSRRFVSNKVNTFIELLKQRFHETPYWDQCIKQ